MKLRVVRVIPEESVWQTSTEKDLSETGPVDLFPEEGRGMASIAISSEENIEVKCKNVGTMTVPQVVNPGLNFS